VYKKPKHKSGARNIACHPALGNHEVPRRSEQDPRTTGEDAFPEVRKSEMVIPRSGKARSTRSDGQRR